MHPEAQQQIVEQHVAFAAPTPLPKVSRRNMRELDAEGFVRPQAMLGQTMQAQPGSEQGNSGEREPQRPMSYF